MLCVSYENTEQAQLILILFGVFLPLLPKVQISDIVPPQQKISS